MTDAVALPTSGDLLGPPERLHPLYLLTGLSQTARGAWGLMAGGAVLASQGRWWIAIALVVGSALNSDAIVAVRFVPGR